MKCPRCQHENPARARFCEECATPLVRTCENCGTGLSATAKFCPQCAHPAGAPAAAPRFPSPEAYTPKHLAEKILTSKTTLEGERKQVTVLFADLKGSMELLADRDPEEARRILDPVLEHMMQAVHRYEGTVNQVMGDGIMALFGAPLAHEDHAVRACYAALRMQETVARYAEEVHRREGVPIQIRVGMNSGEVVVRSIGSDLRMDYTAVGQTTHLAARMEQMARPGAILVTAGTLRLAEGFVAVQPLGMRPVKGLTAPVEVFELAGASNARSRLHAAAARGLTRFVGREAELAQLDHALERAHGGAGQVVAVIGEPGVGKSRLFWEFVRSCRTQGWLVLESGAVAHGKATAYLPLSGLLRSYFQIEGRDDVRKVREKVGGKVVALDETLLPSLPALLALLDVLVEDRAWRSLDPPQRRKQTIDACKRLLIRESQVQPLLLVVEDLHWGDSETQAFLDSLVDALPTARILLLVNYRPEYQHGWVSKTFYTQLRAEPLPAESAGALLGDLLGAEPGLESVKRFLIERTDGNPFFLEESVRTLIEAGILAGDRGGYQLTKPLDGIRVPPTVQAVLAARIDRLPAVEKRLLQSAAVVGKDVPSPVLQAIADLGEEELRRGLEELRAAEFLYEAKLFPDLEYTFKHALTHDVAYESLLHERRRTLHRSIVGAIEQLHPDRLTEHAERLAFHAPRGEVWGKTATYSREAGSKALARSANREAVARFEQAIAALGHLPQSRTALEQAVDLRLDLRVALIALGELDRLQAYLVEAEGLARDLADRRRLGWVSVYLGHYFWITAQAAESRACSDEALAAAKAVGDARLEVLANNYLGYLARTAGEYRRAADFFRTMIRLTDGALQSERIGPNYPAAIARCLLPYTLADLGEFAEGIARGQEGIRLAETLGQPFTTAQCYWGLGYLHGIKGNLGEAVRLLERGSAICREWDVVFMSPFLAWTLGWVYALSSRVEEGLPLMQEGLAGIERLGFRAYEALGDAQLSEALVIDDQLDEAGRAATRALELARARGQRGFEAGALRMLGEVAARRDPPDANAAEDHYRRAMALAEELDMRPLVAHCRFGLGGLSRRTERRSQVREHLAAATALYREMDMGFWREKAEDELRAL